MHWCTVMPCAVIELGQHWFRQWLVVHSVLIHFRTNVGFLLTEYLEKIQSFSPTMIRQKDANYFVSVSMYCVCVCVCVCLGGGGGGGAHRLISIGIPILNIRRSHDHLGFNMRIPIPGKYCLYIETRPRSHMLPFLVYTAALICTRAAIWQLFTQASKS